MFNRCIYIYIFKCSELLDCRNQDKSMKKLRVGAVSSCFSSFQIHRVACSTWYNGSSKTRHFQFGDLGFVHSFSAFPAPLWMHPILTQVGRLKYCRCHMEKSTTFHTGSWRTCCCCSAACPDGVGVKFQHPFLKWNLTHNKQNIIPYWVLNFEHFNIGHIIWVLLPILPISIGFSTPNIPHIIIEIYLPYPWQLTSVDKNFDLLNPKKQNTFPIVEKCSYPLGKWYPLVI